AADDRSTTHIRALIRGAAELALSDLATREDTSRSWDELVVSPRIRKQLENVIRRYQYADDVRLAFPSRAARIERRCTAMLSGPSGTGKTLAARLIASRLGLPLFKVDLSQVVSKSVGETEKKLRQVFVECQKADVVLLFDEADSLF